MMDAATTCPPVSYDGAFHRSTGLRRRVLAMTALTLVLIVLLASMVFVTAQRYRQDQAWTLHTYRLTERILLLINNARDAEMYARSYGLTGREAALRLYWNSISATELDTGDLEKFVAGDPDEARATQQLREAIAARRIRLDQIINDYRSRGPVVAHGEVIALLSGPANPAREIAKGMLDRAAAALKSREADSKRLNRNLTVSAATALAGCLGLLSAALVTIAIEQRRRLHSELELARNAQNLQQALRDTSRTSEILHRLAHMTELLQNCRNLDEAIGVIERALPPLLSETSGCLALINASRNTVEARMQWGTRGPDLADSVFAPDDCWALRRSQPHPDSDETTAPVCPHLIQSGVTSGHSLCLPLSAHGQSLGVLSLCALSPISEKSRQLAATVADQVALALSNLALQASLRTQSIRDPLTSLFNRRYLEASITREMVRAERRKGGLSILMLDLDHFKRYNDTQGHDAGDALLAAFGGLLARSGRREDIPCRFGGEEFLLVVTDADHACALVRAEAIRAATAALVVSYRSDTLPPATVSIGVATYPEHGDSPEALLRMADQALYRAKQLGRNRVASANDVVNPVPEAQPVASGT